MMLFSILLIVNVAMALLLIYFIRVPFEKKPIFIVFLTSGVAVLFSYIASQSLSIWLGVLFFFGIILSGTILIGKRNAWLIKEEEVTQVLAPKRSFHKITKNFENPSGRSIYDEEKSHLYIPKSFTYHLPSLVEDDSFEDFLLKKQDNEITVIEDKQPELENVVELPVLEISMPIVKQEQLVIAEPVDPDSFYEAALQEVAMTEMEIDIDLIHYEEQLVPTEKNSVQIDDVEELSDKWMARRLDALLASEENLSKKLFQQSKEEFIHLDLDVLSNSIEESKTDQDKSNDFEDISALYYNKQRSD